MLAFLVVGLAAYFLAVIQGSSQSFRSLNRLIHFTQWVPGHSMLALGMGFGSIVIAFMYFALPTATGWIWNSAKLAWTHFWVTTVGWIVFLVPFFIAGLIEGSMWLVGNLPFIDSVEATIPYWIPRAIGGGAIVLAQYVFAYHMFVSFVSRPVPEVAEA